MKNSSHIVIIGAGSGGISLAARLRKKDAKLAITIVDPAEMHFYQPYWTLVGAGLAKKEVTGRRIADLIPKGVDWIKDSVVLIDPEKSRISLGKAMLKYDALVVASGLELHWKAIDGLKKRSLPSIRRRRRSTSRRPIPIVQGS